jgi:hypothetical protein
VVISIVAYSKVLITFSIPTMDKKRLLQEIIARVKHDAEKMLASAKATHAEATAEENKAENKYDTRGLEASYLAEAQGRQAEEAEANVVKFEALKLRDYSESDRIGLGALVGVEIGGFRDLYFLGPGAGGIEIEIDDEECTIVTIDSPMGSRLYEAKLAGTFDMNGRAAKIVSLR